MEKESNFTVCFCRKVIISEAALCNSDAFLMKALRSASVMKWSVVDSSDPKFDSCAEEFFPFIRFFLLTRAESVVVLGQDSRSRLCLVSSCALRRALILALRLSA